MLIRTAETWQPGYLDMYCPDDAWCIQVIGWAVVEQWDDAQIVVPRKISTIIDYTRRVGLVETTRKIASRLKDTPKHRQCVAIGFGTVIKAPIGAPTHPLTTVGFIVAGVPLGMERVIVPSDAVVELETQPYSPPQNTLVWCSIPHQNITAAVLYSGQIHDVDVLHETLPAQLQRIAWAHGEHTTITPSEQHERRSTGANEQEPGVILFGYGHYARTCILPHLRTLKLHTIHETDPTIIPSNHALSWDTCPTLRREEHAAAVWIAGFHHTHAPIAVEALSRGMWAVIEKPAVTTRAQCDELAQMMASNPRVLIGFHKRWAKPSQWIKTDLALNGTPCHYHCIVHEIPLPEHHWYRWPSSRSRVLSNGCHWIDHFLWLNDYAPVHSWAMHGKPDNLVIYIELTNGAQCSMVLSDNGSSRIGVRDVIECRAGDRTARWIDGASYQAEDRHTVLRTQQLNPMDAYPLMVSSFCDIIAEDDTSQGEPISSFLTLHKLLLDLDERALSL